MHQSLSVFGKNHQSYALELSLLVMEYPTDKSDQALSKCSHGIVTEIANSTIHFTFFHIAPDAQAA